MWDDVHFAFRRYDPWLAYGQYKTANVLFAVEATRRWAQDGITANAVTPGAVLTSLQRHTDGGRGSGTVPAELRGAPLLGVARYALDPAGARHLWTLSEAMLADAAGA
ncbi:hypothetical protein Slala03_57210 [Streptomyces lavendulae subsp. lavendulae]|nr:hypothetical protein Slala03_57210 [Streptomyces lavendulae subsp. lavendulae]